MSKIQKLNLLNCARLIRQLTNRRNASVLAAVAAEPLELPPAEQQDRNLSPKIAQILDEISHLTLLEVSDLNKALKKRFNIPDAPMMSFAAAMPAPSAGAATAEDDDEGGQAVVAKSSYTVKLLKFADGKKIDLIKEVKNLTTGMNLVQAKKFVETLPQTVKIDLSKDEAEKLKQKLESLGGECEIA